MSADHRCVDERLERSKKQVSIRGLDRIHNYDLKNLFKSAATSAALKAGPFQEPTGERGRNFPHEISGPFHGIHIYEQGFYTKYPT